MVIINELKVIGETEWIGREDETYIIGTSYFNPKGISLSEEWLLKFGLTKEREDINDCEVLYKTRIDDDTLLIRVYTDGRAGHFIFFINMGFIKKKVWDVTILY